MTKRGNGEGTIGRRSDGRWVARVMVAGRRRSFYGHTRAAVADKLAAAMSADRRGAPVVSDRATVAGYAAEWLEATRTTIRWGTWSKREMHMRLHILPVLGRVPLARVTPEQIEKLYGHLLDSGLSRLTVHHIHATLHRMLGQAERRGYVARNVAHLVSAPQAEQSEVRTWTEEQAGAFLRAAAGDPLEPLFTLAITTGLRKSEMLGLRWRDLDLDRRTLHLRSTLERRAGEVRFVEPKTKGSRRKLELTAQAIAALRRQRAAQRELRLAAGPAWAGHDLVFTTERGTPPVESTIRRSLLALIADAGVPTIRFHDLRHTCFTILLAHGIHPKVVSEMAGHSRISVTMDLYSHVTPTMQREAVAAMEKAMGGGR